VLHRNMAQAVVCQRITAKAQVWFPGHSMLDFSGKSGTATSYFQSTLVFLLSIWFHWCSLLIFHSSKVYAT